MRTVNRLFSLSFSLLIAISLVLGAAGLGARDARAASTAAINKSFRAFCSVWMGKLDARQRHNLKKAQPRRNGDGFFVEYVGYSPDLVRCETKAGRTSSIGKLVYHELRIRRAGRTADVARKSKPRVLERIEVMEIFRYDGSRWLY